MSENISLPAADLMQENVSELSSPHLPKTAGQMLKKARTDAGLHIAALAVSLRVPVKRIEALENDQMDQMPDMVFVRALTSSICQALKIDPVPFLEKLPKAALPRLNRDDIAINTPIGMSGAGKESALLSLFTAPWLLGVLLLCLGAVAIYVWPKSSVIAVPEIASTAKILPEVGVSQAKEVQVTTESTIAPNFASNSVLGGVLSDSSASINVAYSTSQQDATTATPTAVTAATSVATTFANDKLVTFKASGQTWVEVKNAAGATLFKQLLKEGESAGASGVPPLTVIVGRADVTQVEVRGKPVDLAPISKSNVARFEVN